MPSRRLDIAQLAGTPEGSNRFHADAAEPLSHLLGIVPWGHSEAQPQSLASLQSAASRGGG